MKLNFSFFPLVHFLFFFISLCLLSLLSMFMHSHSQYVIIFVVCKQGFESR